MSNMVTTLFAYLKQFFRKYLLKLVTIKFLKGAMTGFKGWIVSTLFNWLYNKVMVPLLNFAKRKVNKFFRKRKYKKQAKELKNAKDVDDLADKFRDLP